MASLPPPSSPRSSLLLYEPRAEGHHLKWLGMIAEDLLSAGWSLKLAVDLRPESEAKVRGHISGLVPASALLNACDPARSKAVAAARCLTESGAANVFLCAFDEIASSICRRAACGLFPPAALHGRMGGIYHRPRFLASSSWSPNHWLKRFGFRRLIRQGWLRQLLLLDEFLVADLRSTWPEASFSFLPGPCPPAYTGDRARARQQLDVPADACVFLFYGGGYRRKGLHLVVRAMQELPPELPVFLLCAGQQDPSSDTARGLEELARRNRLRLLQRDQIPPEEERACFIGSDIVLLPYINHFGASDVLFRAMTAAKPVIVSDEQLLGRLVREHRLGLLFPAGDAGVLRERIRQAAFLSADETAEFAAAARRCADRYSRDNFRHALLKSLSSSLPGREKAQA